MKDHVAVIRNPGKDGRHRNDAVIKIETRIREGRTHWFQTPSAHRYRNQFFHHRIGNLFPPDYAFSLIRDSEWGVDLASEFR
jgi:hypothetical protein